MERRLIHGESFDEKMESIERILQSFSQRLSTRVIGIIPPVPLMRSRGKPAEDGTLFGELVPFRGTLTDAYIHVKRYVRKEPTLTVTMTTDAASSSIKVVLQKQLESYRLNWELEAGTIIEARITPSDAVEDIFFGAVIVPIQSAGKIEYYMLEQFLELAKERGDARI